MKRKIYILFLIICFIPNTYASFLNDFWTGFGWSWAFPFNGNNNSTIWVQSADLVLDKNIESNSYYKNIKKFELEKYKRTGLPVSAFILTFIGVAMASQKKRSGMGANLAFGIAVSMIYILFDRIFGILVIKEGFSPLLAAWIPNVLFGILAVYLVYRAKK